MNKNRIKILLIFIFIIFTSGCSVEYNLSLNEDLSVNEVVIATERTDRLESRTKLKGSQAVNYIFNMFTDNNNSYTIDYISKDLDTIATVNATYNSINDYISVFESDIFDDINVSKEQEYVTISANQKEVLGGNSPTTPMYDSIDVIIEIPFNVIEHNADSVTDNKYKWEIRKNDKLKNIKITYEQDDIPNKINIEINDHKYNFENWYIIIFVFIIGLTGLIAVILIKNKKNNIV